jgi:hypothetical protein
MQMAGSRSTTTFDPTAFHEWLKATGRTYPSPSDPEAIDRLIAEFRLEHDPELRAIVEAMGFKQP